MSRTRRAVGILGLVLVVAALIITVSPGLIGPDALPEIGQVPAAILTVVVLVVLGLYGMLSFGVSGIERSGLGIEMEEVPELVRDPDADRVLGYDWEDREEAIERLRDTVERVLVQGRGHTGEQASEIIAAGDWTDDRVAAAFIDTGITYPILERLREWLEETGTLERRVERTVRAIERLHDGEGRA